ncbi:hypothetical protein BJX64DRAFT_300957 [Aspergillus heterothallicus]
MAFWPELRPCFNCRLMQAGHTRKNCPVIKCFRCHEQGHISDDCPNTECSYCRRMGNCKAKCLKLKLKNSKGRKASESPFLPLLANTRAENSTSTVTSLSTDLRSDMSYAKRVLTPQNPIGPQPPNSPPSGQRTGISSWELVPSVVFPNLHSTISHLSSHLVTDSDVYLQRLPYRSVITSLGGPQKVAQMLLEWVDPQIRTLEGRLLRTKDLLSIQARQNNIWSPNGGYVDIVTDDRNREYWRAYPGQSKDPSTLHYYVIAQGQGYRAANWLKLWEVPKDTELSCTFRAVALNILEMTMCCAFQSLPGSILETYYGPREDGKPYSNLGLNIIPPVLQGISLGPSVRKYPDIIGWPQFRYEYGRKAEKSDMDFRRPLLRSSEFHSRFQDTPLSHSNFNKSELFNQLRRDLEPVALAESEGLSNAKISMPRQFQDSANPMQRALIETEAIVCFNQSIIRHSRLRVVLMCGRAVQDLVLPTNRRETRLKLESGEFPMFLDVENGVINRIYVSIPNPVDAFLLREWRKTHKISEALHFTSALTNTVGIRPYSGDDGCVLTKAIRDFIAEQKGLQNPLKLDELHPMTRLWLTRRGFAKDEDIFLLQEKGGGSLSNAILVLLHVTSHSSRNSPTTSSMSSFHRSKKRHAPEFKIDEAQLESVRELSAQLSKELLVEIDRPIDCSIHDIEAMEDEFEEESEHEVGEADVLERENLETSEISIDDHGKFTLAVEALVAPWERRPPRAGAGGRSFTVGDRTREELLQGRKYFGTRTRRNNLFVVTVHSFIELFLQVEKPPDEAIVKAEIKPPGQRHPHGESVADIITKPRQFVTVSSLTRTLPRGISQPGSFYTNDHITVIPAKEFDPRKKHRMDTV